MIKYENVLGPVTTTDGLFVPSPTIGVFGGGFPPFVRTNDYACFCGNDASASLATPVVIQVGKSYSIKFNMFLTGGDTTRRIVSGSTNVNNEFSIDSPGNDRVRANLYDGNALQGFLTSTTTASYNQINIEVTISATGFAELFVDGVKEGPDENWIVNGLQDVQVFANRAVGNQDYFGVLSDIVITEDGIELVNCPMDQKDQTVQPNLADPANPITIFGGDIEWYERIGGVYVAHESVWLSPTVAGGAVWNGSELIFNADNQYGYVASDEFVYRFAGENTLTSGQVEVLNTSAGGSSAVIVPNGTFSVDVSVFSGAGFVTNGPTTATLSNISVKKVLLPIADLSSWYDSEPWHDNESWID